MAADLRLVEGYKGFVMQRPQAYLDPLLSASRTTTALTLPLLQQTLRRRLAARGWVPAAALRYLDLARRLCITLLRPRFCCLRPQWRASMTRQLQLPTASQ